MFRGPIINEAARLYQVWTASTKGEMQDFEEKKQISGSTSIGSDQAVDVAKSLA